MLPHSIQKVSLSIIGISLLMLMLLLLERLGVFHFFGSCTSSLISIFSILIYISIFFSLISSEKEENKDIKSLRAKIASLVSFTYLILLLCYKIIEAIFIKQGITDIIPVSSITSGKVILLFFLIYIIILKISIKKKYRGRC